MSSSSLPRRGTMRQRATASAAAKVAGTVRLKLLLLGDAGAGKTSLLRRYNSDASTSGATGNSSSASFDVQSAPTVGVDFVACSSIGRRPASEGRYLRVQANFFDVSGSAHYAKVRQEFYQEQHGVLFAFDLSSRTSWEHVESLWWAEAQALAGPRGPDGQPLPGSQPVSLHAVVLGCKADVVESGGTRAVSERDARQWCKSRGASYFECSAKTGQGVAKAIDYWIEHAQAEARPMAGGGGGASPPPQQPAGAASAASSSSSSAQQPQRPPSASPTGSANINELSLSELRRECAKRGIRTDDCLEKSDVLQRLREHLARERDARASSAQDGKLKEERARDAVHADVARWAQGVSRGSNPDSAIRSMLNDIHGWSEGHASFLAVHASLGPVSAAYKRALLKIHPDKVDVARDGQEALWRATEMFKTVNAAFEAFKKANEKRMSAGGAAGGAAAEEQQQPRYSPSSSPTPRTRATSRR